MDRIDSIGKLYALTVEDHYDVCDYVSINVYCPEASSTRESGEEVAKKVNKIYLLRWI